MKKHNGREKDAYKSNTNIDLERSIEGLEQEAKTLSAKVDRESSKVFDLTLENKKASREIEEYKTDVYLLEKQIERYKSLSYSFKNSSSMGPHCSHGIVHIFSRVLVRIKGPGFSQYNERSGTDFTENYHPPPPKKSFLSSCNTFQNMV